MLKCAAGALVVGARVLAGVAHTADLLGSGRVLLALALDRWLLDFIAGGLGLGHDAIDADVERRLPLEITDLGLLLSE